VILILRDALIVRPFNVHRNLLMWVVWRENSTRKLQLMPTRWPSTDLTWPLTSDPGRDDVTAVTACCSSSRSAYIQQNKVNRDKFYKITISRQSIVTSYWSWLADCNLQERYSIKYPFNWVWVPLNLSGDLSVERRSCNLPYYKLLMLIQFPKNGSLSVLSNYINDNIDQRQR